MERITWLVMVVCALILVERTSSAQQTLLIIEPTATQPRNSEGDLILLKNGALCLIYTRFTGGTADHSAADLAMRVSRDRGKTWSDDRIVVQHEGNGNVMSVSLLRLADGRIALFYCRKRSLEDCRVLMRVSSDETATFGPATECITDEVGYYVLNNDRVVQLASGRLVVPVALHNKPGQERPDWAGRVMCYLSDDIGKTWRRSDSVLTGHAPDGQRLTVQEPGVVQLNDGRVMMFCRTNGGCQYVSFSRDQGVTWTQLEPSALKSPVSPATIERIPWSAETGAAETGAAKTGAAKTEAGELLCVWNDHSGFHPFPAGKRTPLCIAASADEGKSWASSRIIERNPNGWYCYTAMMFMDDQIVLAYCAGDTKVGGLNRLKVTSLSRSWLEQLQSE